MIIIKRIKKFFTDKNIGRTTLIVTNIILSIATIVSLAFTAFVISRNSYLSQYRPYVGIEKIVVKEDKDRMNVAMTLVNVGLVPANDVRLSFEQFVDGELSHSGGSRGVTHAILMPVPTRQIYKFWAGAEFVKGHDWEVKVIIEYDGVKSDGHKTEFTARYNPDNNAFNMLEGYVE